MKINELMSKKIVKITSTALLPDAARKMKQENVGVLPVEDNGHVVGILTDRDITIEGVAGGHIDRPVKDVMTKKLVTIQETASVDEAIETMVRNKVRRLVVMRDGSLSGMISLEDLVESGNDKAIIKALHDFHQQTRHK